ncbi:MAG: peptidylprolyl isomerase [Abditibacteriota bacterium]|nr:peptidylprolyl isomerase [Abditibacteriota bacterium]
MKKYTSFIIIIMVLALVAVFNTVTNTSREKEKATDTGHSHTGDEKKILEATLIFNNVIVLDTTRGKIEIAVLKKDIPNASKRMLKLARKNLFKDIPVLTAKDWLVQFGEVPMELKPLEKETAYSLLSCNYAVGLAHRKSPDSGTSSIFIIREPSFTVVDNYTIFGYVVKGQDVVQKMTGEDSIISSSVRKKTKADSDELAAVLKKGNKDHGIATQFEMAATAKKEMEAAKALSEQLPGNLDQE